eukprot:GSChrysophyteH1.ASY1.ANO1.1917.1 assembled CDS
MSKSLKNYPDPLLVIDSNCADALRLYLINSPVVRAESLKFSENGVKEVVRGVLLPWYNNNKGFVPDIKMKAYRLYTVVPRLVTFIEELTNWYLRLNRDRIKGTSGDGQDQLYGLNVMFEVLMTMTQIMSPFTPFFAENMYQGLRRFCPLL